MNNENKLGGFVVQVTRLVDDVLIWIVTGIIAAGVWSARKLFAMNTRIDFLEDHMEESDKKSQKFDHDISLIKTELTSNSADLRNLTKNTDRILDILERSK